MSLFVEDQDAALAFYTDVLGFVARADVPLGEHRWLTVVSPEDPDGVELVLEPGVHAETGRWKASLVAEGIPYASFGVVDVVAETERLTALGVVFTQAPVTTGPVTTAVFDDTCGNLVQIMAVAGTG